MANVVTVTIEYNTGRRIESAPTFGKKVIEFKDSDNELTRIARRRNALDKILTGYYELSSNSNFGVGKFWLALRIKSVHRQYYRSDKKLKTSIYKAMNACIHDLSAIEIVRCEYDQDKPLRIDPHTRIQIEEILNSDQLLIDPNYIRITSAIRDGENVYPVL